MINATQIKLTEWQKALLNEVDYPTPLQDILDCKHGRWDGWTRFLPSVLEEQWGKLSVETKIAAYSVAMAGFSTVQDLLKDH
jgi:hypothetical protein